MAQRTDPGALRRDPVQREAEPAVPHGAVAGVLRRSDRGGFPADQQLFAASQDSAAGKRPTAAAFTFPKPIMEPFQPRHTGRILGATNAGKQPDERPQPDFLGRREELRR